MKGAPRAHPLVTMRLETPVIYFYYPPKGMTEPFPVDVNVKFRGGWLTQFYPHAVFQRSANGNRLVRLWQAHARRNRRHPDLERPTSRHQGRGAGDR